MPTRRPRTISSCRTGAGQTTLSYDNVLTVDFARFNEQAADRLVRGAQDCTFMWAINNRKVTSIQVRRALGYAFPYRASWEAAGNILGVTRLEATNVLPPGTPGRVAYNPLPGHTPWDTDPAKARALLTQAGELGYLIRFPFNPEDPLSVAVKNVVSSAFRAAGFEPRPVAPTQFARNPYAANPDLTIAPTGWCTDWPTGSSWFPPLFGTRGLAHPGSNSAFFSSGDIDDRMASISSELLSRQPASWNALDQRIQTQYFPVVVTGYAGAVMPRGSKVNNDFDDPTFGMPTWKDIWLG
jgi:peptide/nickel transport system substrate-binding protein